MTRRIRFLLVLTVVGLAGAFLLAPAQAQLPPGGVGGRPAGGIGGQPPGGIGGGVGGQHPGNAGGINGHVPKIGPIEYEWICGRCKAVVGHGAFKPNLTNCPHCGVKFINGGVDFHQGAQFHPPARDQFPDNAGQNVPANNNNAAVAAQSFLTRFLMVGLLGFGAMVVLIAVVVVLVIVVNRSGNTASTPRSSRSRVYHDV